MGGKGRWLVAPLLAVFCLVYSAGLAEEGKEAEMAKLKELRQKKADMTAEYEANLDSVEKIAADKMAVIKSDFRKAREACLEERHSKSEQLRKDYEAKLKPMLKEETQLIKTIGREAKEDFAKPRHKRQ